MDYIDIFGTQIGYKKRYTGKQIDYNITTLYNLFESYLRDAIDLLIIISDTSNMHRYLRYNV
jgi:hypothetical protein